MATTMGRMARPYTERQPSARASGGANSMASTAPLLPAPAIPIASPL